ncbi:MAG: cytochrome c biogenesis protein CcdA [Chloroflexaceae bacterium]|nr:cytochrome c biogenesis protein CcdA [Chloroflexaceae bacterium]NJO05688.1 cytochrome c biogenesis protein CcdA [Chloroflexaceae bacterium]
MTTQPVNTPQSDAAPITTEKQSILTDRRLLLFGGLLAVVVLGLAILNIGNENARFLTGGSGSVLVLALPAFLAGIFSFLSPCTLPILPAYFAFTFQAQRQSIVVMTIAFFLGLATTMTLLGAITTGITALLFDQLDALTFWGGMIVIGFGILSILGKGFAGPQMQERPVASVAGSYLYGATFALGWTACVGPILGALLTLLASQGVAIVQGALLAFIYAMGMGLPLIIMATFFSRLGQGSRFWRIMRGRGFDVNIGSFNLHLHTTSVASGIMLVIMGWLLASGQLATITEQATFTPLAQWVLDIEHWVTSLFGL